MLLVLDVLQIRRWARHAGVGVGPREWVAGVMGVGMLVGCRCRRQGLTLTLGLRLQLAGVAVEVAPRRAEGGGRPDRPDGRDGVLISLVGPGGLDRPVGPDGHVVALVLAVVRWAAVQEAVAAAAVVATGIATGVVGRRRSNHVRGR